MTVNEIMTTQPETCAPGTTLQQVAQLMVQHDCGEIPVCDENGKPIGVVTDRDIVCRAIATGKNPSRLTALDCMSFPVVATTPDVSVEDCALLMKAHQVRRLPVLDENGNCCGMVSQADLATKGPERATLEVVARVSAPTTVASSVRRG
jgi:CBS domain-containing protein